MTVSHRHPTPEEIDAILAHARQLRSLYLAALCAQAALRVRQRIEAARERRALVPRRFYPDVC